ncbi:MAG: hypothetical protein ABW250_02465 [Pyrinomonadaceae bacterium]
MFNLWRNKKRQAQEKRLAALVEQYAAANDELDQTPGFAHRVIIERQIKDLEGRIEKIQSELEAGAANDRDEVQDGVGEAPVKDGPRPKRGRLKAFRNWFTAARRRVQVATVVAFALTLGVVIYGGILLKRYIRPSLYPRPFSEPFDKTADGRPDTKVWTLSKGGWAIVPGREDDPDDQALEASGTGVAFARGKVFRDFVAEFTVQHLSGTRAGWMLRAWPDWRGGYCGYYFELIREGENLILEAQTHKCFFGRVSLDVNKPDRQLINIKNYGQRPDDNIYVKVTAEGNKFSYLFRLQSTDPKDPHVDTKGVVELFDDDNHFTTGHFGLVGVDADSKVLYEYIRVTPGVENKEPQSPPTEEEPGS